ncbi:histidine phosphatase family protein [Virgibacillus dokdonensis]|uniref:Histidine phosphatase family protein n=1 Tax=Virgibacillus dokdonensis TaxID=302167 RepID=A0A3E0WL42_9BACI|nr:histidine phosphatase family protein [Virgibacillus dokdonensis]RFA33528.1 histidine phosphatase family protein [Virgibacillus dokdonensis]
MLTNLYFVRHAHSVYTPGEMRRPLSERGFKDSKVVTDLLKKEKIDCVFASPYKRAIQTVEGIAAYIHQEIIIVDGFKERILAGEPVKDFTAAITKVWQEENFAWQGGESNKTAQKRAIDSLSRILGRNAGKNLVIGTHGNIMVLMMSYFDNRYGFDFWKCLEMPDIYKLSFEEKKLMEVEQIWERIDLAF